MKKLRYVVVLCALVLSTAPLAYPEIGAVDVPVVANDPIPPPPPPTCPPTCPQ